MGSSTDWTQPRRASLSLKAGHQKLKVKEKENENKRTKHPEHAIMVGGGGRFIMAQHIKQRWKQLINKSITGHPILEYQKENRQKGAEEIFEVTIAEHLPKLMRHQNTDLGCSENTKQDKYQKTISRSVILKRKKMNRERILHEAGVGLEMALSTATEITADLSSYTSRQPKRIECH